LNDILKDGENVQGKRVEGLGDLTAKGGDVMDELKKRLKELEAPIKDVRDRVLAEKNLKAIDDTFASLSEFTGNLKTTSKGLDEVILQAKDAAATLKDTIASAKPALAKIDAAAAELKPTLAQIKAAAATADKALDSAKTLMNKANTGRGALGLLLGDKETADNLKALIRNLREHGVLWYKNR
jgi:chromosome segregation ATPase